MESGSVGDMVELGITESYQVKRQVLISAAEAAEMILRVDDILKSAPRCVHMWSWSQGSLCDGDSLRRTLPYICYL